MVCSWTNGYLLMLLNETINIPEEFFGIGFQDVQVKIVNEALNGATNFIDGEIAIVRLLENGSFLGREFHILLHGFEENGTEELIINRLKEIINNNV